MPNSAPSGQDGIRTTLEEGVITFAQADFGFSDTDGNFFAGIVITTAPTGGRLMLGGSTLVAGQFVTAAQISSGSLRYIPNTNGSGMPYDSFTFQVRDSGGTADGGVDTDQSPNTITINVTPQPDGPVVGNFSGTAPGFRVAFTEDAGPVFLDVGRNATVTDVDSPNFNGGLLRVGFPSDTPDFPGFEDFSIFQDNGITVTSQAVGGIVSHNGTAFGTITIDQDRLLEVTFNTEATPERIQQLVRNLTYNLTGNDGAGGTTRSPVLVLKDGTGGEALLTGIRIDITGVDDPPQLTDLASTVSYAPGVFAGGPQLIDANVTYYEPDNSPYGLQLRVAGMVAGDVVAVRNQGTANGQISILNTGIYYHRQGATDLIATFSGGTLQSGPLVIEFTTGADSSARVEQVIENLTFYNPDANPQASRTLTLSFTDRFGNMFSQDIQVHTTFPIVGTGGDDTINGTPGNDVIDGGPGADTMIGGDGNDVYYVDNPGDVVVEAVGGGSDQVLTTVDYTLTAGSEIEVFQPANIGGTAPLALTGNEFGQTIDGNSGDNVLHGGGGDDIIFGYVGNDTLYGDGGRDLLFGQQGNDIYHVDEFDDVFEDVNGGIDRVLTTVSFMLASGSYVEFLETENPAGTVQIDLTGNDLGQTITGNAGLNILRGNGGNDTLIGLGGDDYLLGGTGTDTLTGGLGNDTYYIEDSSDTIVENAGEGNDRVATLIGFTIPNAASIEILEVTNSTSTYDVDLSGNGVGQLIAGNMGMNVIRGFDGNDVLAGYAGNDTLEGGAGDDILIGGTGNDTMNGGTGSDKYYVEDAGDVLIEPVAPGDDVVAAGVSYTLAEGVDIERLEPITFGSTAALNFTGNEFGTYVIGNNGANVLNGGFGADVLEGLGGADSFAFTTTPGGANVDQINDFAPGTDKILLENAVFTGLAAGALGANAFVTGSAAGDADDRIIYNSATGALLFDADGNGAGAAVQFATVGTGLAITANDFLVI